MTQLALEGLLATSRKHAQRRQQRPTTAHTLLSLLQADADVARLLGAVGVHEAGLLAALRLGTEEPTQCLDRAAERAQKLAKRTDPAAMVRPIHMLAAITLDPRAAGVLCLERLGASVVRLQSALEHELGLRAAEPPAPSTVPSLKPVVARAPADAPAPPATEQRARTQPPEKRPSEKSRSVPTRTEPVASPYTLDPERFPMLSKLGRNLSERAVAGTLDPVFERDREVGQILDVLARRRGGNPLLVGPPGCGKTALIEAVALELVRTKRPTIVVELTPGGLQTGTGVRGSMAEKLRKLKAELQLAEGRVVLFIDEIHAIVGEAAHGDDGATELKGALARGEVVCLGATTDAEYQKHFGKDPAFARRFSVVHVTPPSPSASRRILEGLRPSYAAHHQVTIDDSALEAAIDLSVRFLPEQTLPDKAIRLIDLAGARVARRGEHTVDAREVAELVSAEASVPVERLIASDAERLLALEDELRTRVVGQDANLTAIAEAVRKGAAGFRGKRPLGTFLFLGSTGVGKTETAKALAEVLFAPNALTRIDMSELSEPHSVARLLGAPPGYVGHELGGQLTEPVRKRPYQLVLLDEIEKAHPEVLLALLPLLDEGRITDGRGRTVDFTNTLIVLTSNLGAAEALARPKSVGFGSDTSSRIRTLREALLAAARRGLPPELWNRIDEPLVFEPLSREAVLAIAARMVEGTQRMLAERGIVLMVDPSALEALVCAGGYEATLGARPMRRAVGRLVEAQVAKLLLAGAMQRGQSWRLIGHEECVELVPTSSASRTAP